MAILITLALSLVALISTPILLVLAWKLVDELLTALAVWEAKVKALMVAALSNLVSDFMAWRPVVTVISVNSNIRAFALMIRGFIWIVLRIAWEWKIVFLASIFALRAVTSEPNIFSLLAPIVAETVEFSALIFTAHHSPPVYDGAAEYTAHRSLVAPASDSGSKGFQDWYVKSLPLPTKDDDLRSTAIKLRDLRAVVQRGHSLGKATHWKWIEDETGIEARWIEKNLSHEEFAHYMAWQNGASPPPVDWDVRTAMLVYWVRKIFRIHLKASDDLIPALQTLYPGYQISPRQAYCFYTRHRDMLPLARAVKKLHRVGLVFVKDVALWTSVHKAEWLTVRRAAEAFRLGRDADLSNKYVQSIRTSIRVMRIREQTLKWQVTAFEERLRSEEFV